MSKLSELIVAAKARKAAADEAARLALLASQANVNPTPIAEAVNAAIGSPESTLIHTGQDIYGNPIEWNADQWQFIELASGGKSSILIGAAGTGKTTTMYGAITKLLQDNYYPPMEDEHKHLPYSSAGIVCVSYTRRAVMNLRKALPADLKFNCITIHKLLEYAPVFYEIEDPISHEMKNTMRFEPSRGTWKKLSANIKTIIIDESSMVSVDLFHKIWLALPDPRQVQFIFLGDIQQLPPIFGSAILGFKMLSLPVVELTTVYRQALESPIIRLAHRILSGVPINCERNYGNETSGYAANQHIRKTWASWIMMHPEDMGFEDWKVPGKLTLHPWKKKISPDSALLTIAAFFKRGYDTSHYQPDEDMILIPFNKSCGTDELNKHIANHIARKKKLVTHEVIAGFVKHYFSDGEKILYEKEDAEIVSIKRNPTYSGKWPQPASHLLDYWGTVQAEENKEVSHHITAEEETDQDIDVMLSGLTIGDDTERVREASHILTIRLLDSGRELEIKSAAEINALVMAYALTVHKSQGSEWRKVFLLLHQSHNTMIQRELLYTGVTRAREELYVICEPDSFIKGINGQRIKGNTLEEKSTFFQGKVDSGDYDLIAQMNNSPT